MNEFAPRLRVKAESGISLLRDGVSLAFYIRHPHRQIAQAILQALDTYNQEVGPRALGRYFDEEGMSQELDDPAWKRLRQQMFDEKWPSLQLADADASEYGYRFEYCGKPLDAPSLKDKPEATCTLGIWLPTEYLEARGPGRLRALALDLCADLPFCFGQVGLSFNAHLGLIGVRREVHKYCFRYPGMDISDPGAYSLDLGTQVRGPAWMTFLGNPVLGQLGGVAALRARLSSPGTLVQELPGERAVITLGPRPEAGDLTRGDTLPAYRELARVLEPWLHEETSDYGPDFPPEDLRRWERRFLD